MTETTAPASGWDCHVHVFDAAQPVIGGHYRPANHPLSDIEAQAALTGVRHLVLVQPSVYGSDNSLLLRALNTRPGRHRGVVVLSGQEADHTLQNMHAAGVRGARLNCVSPAGEGAALASRFDLLAPRLKALGWHLEWYVKADQLAEVAALHAGSGIVGVLDHLAGMHSGCGPQHSGWAALKRLSAAGSWVKLSGWYRLDAVAPYGELWPQARHLAGLFDRRLLWGSDWPHTAFDTANMPSYNSQWQPVVQSLGADAAAALSDGAAALYA